MRNNYAIIYFDSEDGQWRYISGLTKKACKERIKLFNLGKDLISHYHVVRLVDAWNAYDGLFIKGGKLYEE